jgi:uncharacterized protein YndB with AHSA1/START domain
MIRRLMTVPVSAQQVWDAITDPEQIPGWFGGEMEWVLEPGGGLTYRGQDGERRRGTVEEVRPGRRLRFVWWEADDEGDASEVTYLIQPSPTGATLTVQETPLNGRGPRGGTAPGAAEDTLYPPRGRPKWNDWDSRLAGAWVSLSDGARTGARA